MEFCKKMQHASKMAQCIKNGDKIKHNLSNYSMLVQELHSQIAFNDQICCFYIKKFIFFKKAKTPLAGYGLFITGVIFEMRAFTVKRIIIAIIILFAAIQFIPVERTNPPESAPLQAQSDIMQILKSSCFDCHSNQTVWPLYSKIAPLSWVIADHVNDGRRHLNFSKWNEYSPKKQLRKLDELAEEVEEGKMPLDQYLYLHSEAKLSPAEKEKLLNWAHTAMDSVQLD